MSIRVADEDPMTDSSTPVWLTDAENTIREIGIMEMTNPGPNTTEVHNATNTDSRIDELERAIASIGRKVSEMEQHSYSVFHNRMCDIERFIATVADTNTQKSVSMIDSVDTASRSRVFLAPRSRSAYAVRRPYTK